MPFPLKIRDLKKTRNGRTDGRTDGWTFDIQTAFLFLLLGVVLIQSFVVFLLFFFFSFHLRARNSISLYRRGGGIGGIAYRIITRFTV